MAEKTYVAGRDMLKVHEGHIHSGEAFPAAEVTPSLLTMQWVREGNGTKPRDKGTHTAFGNAELAALKPAAPVKEKKPPKGATPPAAGPRRTRRRPRPRRRRRARGRSRRRANR